jgi:two-component system sensor histidine kinase PhoQ
MAAAGWAVQRAHADSVRVAHFARLQGTVYLLLAAAELDAGGALQMPAAFAEPRLSLPGSGLYAGIFNTARSEQWQSQSALGADLPFQREEAVGQWRYDTLDTAAGSFLAATYGVRWATTQQREAALAPLRRVAGEIRRIESGEQSRIEGHYPAEIAGLTDNLNTLIAQERVRQTRYKEALSFLAHSLKTPLAVLRTALAEPAQLPAAVAQQVARMDDIVQHQLGRAAASGASRFAPLLALAPVLERVRDSLDKVYADKGLAITVDCPPGLGWRIDEGDAFEILGNLMDNAAKWARHSVAARVWRDADRLVIRIEDDGPGFSDVQSILQLHVRLDERVPGHGVGLAVVNDLVASHQGELKLSRADLGGARVEIVLPAA